MNKLIKLRKKIDKIDSNLIKIMAKRLKVTEKVKIFKLKNKLPLENKNRELEIMNKNIKLGEKLNLNSKLIKIILSHIIKEAKKQ